MEVPGGFEGVEIKLLHENKKVVSHYRFNTLDCAGLLKGLNLGDFN